MIHQLRANAHRFSAENVINSAHTQKNRLNEHPKQKLELMAIKENINNFMLKFFAYLDLKVMTHLKNIKWFWSFVKWKVTGFATQDCDVFLLTFFLLFHSMIFFFVYRISAPVPKTLATDLVVIAWT